MAVDNPFVIGIKTGSFLRKLFCLDNSGLVIAHRIKGRRRYTSKTLKGKHQLCAVIEKALRRFPCFTSIAVNPVTGSITVTYTAAEQVIDTIFDTVSHQISGRHAQQEKTIIPPTLINAGNNLNDTARKVRHDLKVFLNHTEPLFLSRITGVILAAYGLSRVIFRGERPSGVQLFWWGLALLLRQTHRHYRHLAARSDLLAAAAKPKAGPMTEQNTGQSQAGSADPERFRAANDESL